LLSRPFSGLGTFFGANAALALGVYHGSKLIESSMNPGVQDWLTSHDYIDAGLKLTAGGLVYSVANFKGIRSSRKGKFLSKIKGIVPYSLDAVKKSGSPGRIGQARTWAIGGLTALALFPGRVKDDAVGVYDSLSGCDTLIEKADYIVSEIGNGIIRDYLSGAKMNRMLFGDVVTKSLESIIPSNFKSGNRLTSAPWSNLGRFERTYRWDDKIDKAEKSRGIPKGLLAGLIMVEGGGDPIMLNGTNDGGAGLMQFQPGTAQAHGLKTYGTSKATGKDIIHGRKLRRFVEINKSNYDKLTSKDDRFNVKKSINAGADHLGHLYRTYKTWDNALSAYNNGTPVRNARNTKHVKKSRQYQKYYVQRDRT